MNIYDVLTSYRGIPNVIRPLDLEKDIEIYQSMENYNACKEILESVGCKIENILVTNAQMGNVFYADVESGVYIDLFPFVPDIFKMVCFEKRYPTILNTQREHLEKQEYEMFYFMIPNALKVYDFERRYLTIPEDKVSDVWMDVYTDIDYNFLSWNKEVIDYVASHTKRKNSNKMITVYRGEGTKSTPINKSYSWTTDINVALWFASKGEGRRLWTGQVRERDIMFRPKNRDEHEVIVAPKHVKNRKNLGLYSGETNAVVEKFSCVRSVYEEYGEHISEIYEEQKGHGINEHSGSHIARVLVNALLIADEMDLSYKCQDILAVAALFHDCARFDDGPDKGHGRRSAEKMLKSEQFKELTSHLDNDKDMIYHLVAYHDVEDVDAVPELKKLKHLFKEDILLLYNILKDADAMDRYRFAGYRHYFDYKYLRNDASKTLLFVTAALSRLRVQDLVLKNTEKDEEDEYDGE